MRKAEDMIMRACEEIMDNNGSAIGVDVALLWELRDACDEGIEHMKQVEQREYRFYDAFVREPF